MRGLTLTQPWATLIAIGENSIETRSWGTLYRGELVIHSAKGFPHDARELCAESPYREVLAAGGYSTQMICCAARSSRWPISST